MTTREETWRCQECSALITDEDLLLMEQEDGEATCPECGSVDIDLNVTRPRTGVQR